MYAISPWKQIESNIWHVFIKRYPIVYIARLLKHTSTRTHTHKHYMRRVYQSVCNKLVLLYVHYDKVSIFNTKKQTFVCILMRLD